MITERTASTGELLAILREHLHELREEFGVEALWLFGSRVTGESREDSDLDVLVEYEDGARTSMFSFVRLENRLAGLLGFKVDLVMKDALKPRIGERIMSQLVAV